MSIAQNVKALRTHRNWTQIELAHRSGLTQAQISRVEDGHDNLKIRTLRDLARAFECSVPDLLPVEDRKKPPVQQIKP